MIEGTPDSTYRGLKFGARQPSGTLEILGLIAALAAAVLVGLGTLHWASTAVELPFAEGIITGLGQKAPERPLVGTTPPPACATFADRFASLARSMGDTMGVPVECPHVDASTGDTLQRTSNGLAIFRQQSQTATFTDGHRRWATDTQGRGLITWEGEALDPPQPAD